jgi:hypothetical protein
MNCRKIYNSEINLRIGWLWDAGIEVRLGDDVFEAIRECCDRLREDVDRRRVTALETLNHHEEHSSTLICPSPLGR